MADAPYRNRTLEAYARRTDAMEADKDAEHALHKDLQKAQDRIEKLETMVARLAGHAHEAQELHDVGAGGLIDEAREVLDGEEGPHLENITDLADEVERLREGLRDCRQLADELQGDAYGVTPADIHRRAEIALDGAEDGDHE
jgi:prefoldin subunit 5